MTSAPRIDPAHYADLIEQEAAFWDAEFVEHPQRRFKCFFHENDWVRARLTIPLINKISALVAPSHKVLELGCGHGWLTHLLSPRAARVVGSDVAPKSLERARAQAARLGLANCEFIRLDANRDPIPDAPYDMIVTWGALHHFADLPHAAAEIRRALSPEGCLVVCECIDRTGLRARLARALAAAFHLILPTDRSYAEKLAYAFRRLARRPEEHAWSPFEMAGGAAWQTVLAGQFSLQHRRSFMGFASPFLARIAGPRWLHAPLSAGVYALDCALVRLHVLEPEYHFLIYKQHAPGIELGKPAR